MSNINFALLSDYPEVLPQVAKWYFAEWNCRREGETVKKSAVRLQKYLESNDLPSILLALKEKKPIGVAQLKYFELRCAYPDFEHWLGGVYVIPSERGRGLASKLVQEIERLAARCSVKTLYLQTEALDGGLYAKLGWLPVEQYQGENQPLVLIMKRIVAS